MSDSKNIYFISESIPHKGFGSFIIFYRHLTRLKLSGYRVFLIIPNYQEFIQSIAYKKLAETFSVIIVEVNRWWFPPYRYYFKISRSLRYFLIYFSIKERLNENPPNFIITYFYGNLLNGFATFLKNKFQCKMGTFLHDDKHLLNAFFDSALQAYDRFICKKSDVIWSVSEELKIIDCSANYICLPPIPQGSDKLVSKPPQKRLIIGFAGSIYTSYFPLFELMAKTLEQLGGELHIITDNVKRVYSNLKVDENIKVIKSFEDSTEALNYLVANCSVIFCGYPDKLDEMPWIETCFPSKFVEFIHSGLPIILSGPANSSLSKWAKKNDWQLFVKDLSQKSLYQLFMKLRDTDFYERNIQQSIFFSQTVFNPKNIQHQFESSISELLVTN